MANGVFITMEGVDGAGKTTQIRFLQRWLAEQKIDVVSTREPGGTRLGERLRNILLAGDDSGRNFALGDDAELLLIFAARMQHLDEVIVPAIKQNKWVLCDRFTDSSYAYQGGGRGISQERIARLENWVQRGLQPDLTILLDVPIEAGLQSDIFAQYDHFETQQIEFKQAVRAVYLQRAKDFPGRIKCIDARDGIDAVRKKIILCVKNYL